MTAPQHPLHPPAGLRQVGCACLGHGLYVRPVPGTVDQGLEDDERRAAEHGNLAPFEGHPAHARRNLAVEAVNVEEDVERRVLPPHSYLSVALHGAYVELA